MILKSFAKYLVDDQDPILTMYFNDLTRDKPELKDKVNEFIKKYMYGKLKMNYKITTKKEFKSNLFDKKGDIYQNVAEMLEFLGLSAIILL
jgi:hypothetical protein